MHKLILIFAVILMVAVSPSCSAAAEEMRIGDIVITGLTRTDKTLVLRYLPVKIGDKWSKDTQELLEQALFEANIFNPFALEISTEEMTKDQVRVVINLADPSYFMLHPLIYVLAAATDLSFSQLNQRIINPWGNGVSFLVGVNWMTDDFENDNPGPWQKFGLDILGADGRMYNYEYKNFEEHEEFNQRRFDLTGDRHVISMRHMISLNLTMKYSLTYQDADYLEKGHPIKQEYLVSTVRTELKDLCIDLGHGFALGEEGTEFNFCSFDFAKIYDLCNEDEDQFVLCLKGGLATDDTPLNFQFSAGGYSDLPLRGHEFVLAGNAYLVSNIEYHKQFLEKKLLGIVFMDFGKVAVRRGAFSKADFLLDAGIGIGYNSPLGLIRLDKGFNLLAEGDTWNITFGHTF